LDWNNRQFDPSKRLRISIPIIKELATPFGASYQPMIQKVLTERAEDIDNLHSRLLLGVRHNAAVPEKDSIIQSLIVSLQGD
jgi:phosphoenolpyruvate-protein kinase (PTS system EI component)